MIIDSKDLSIPFVTNISTKIIFGNNAFDDIGKICNNYGNSVLLVTGQSSIKNYRVDFIKTELKYWKINFCSYNNVSSDPTVHHINDIIEIGIKNNSNIIIGLGGGSVIDAAKAAAIVLKQGGKVEDYLTNKISVKDSSIPLIAIPTTAGTGSELSKGAIISWPEMNIKSGIRGEALLPSVALVDPLLTLTLPVVQVKITGFDCLAHAVETYISKLANPLTSIFSANAIKSVVKYLPIALNDLNDLEARTQLSFNSMIMGYNLANSSTCLPHRLQYPLGTITKTAHALGLAVLYPNWLKITNSFSRNKFTNVANWFAEGLSLPGNNSNNDIIDLFNIFFDKIKLTSSSDLFSFSKKDRYKMASLVTGKLDLDPWWNKEKDLSIFYKIETRDN